MTLDRLLRFAATGIVAVCLLAICGSLAVITVPSIRESLLPADPAEGIDVGERLGLDPAVFASSASTVAIFIRSSCAACQRAAPTYANIVRAVRRRPSTGVRVVFGSDDSGGWSYALSLGVQAGEVVEADLEDLGLRAVPTVVVTDSQGVIRFIGERAPRVGEQTSLLADVLAATRLQPERP